MADGSILVASTYDRLLLSGLPGERLRPVASTFELYDGGLNDLVVGPSGTAYVSPFDSSAPHSRDAAQAYRPSAPLIMLQRGAVSRVAEGLEGPNGLAFLEGGRVLLVAETFGQRLTAFTVDDDGGLGHRRTYADLPGRGPDGITVDANGSVWVACPFENEIIRVAEGGGILEAIPTPGRWAVATALGGADGRTLFCTTAATTLRQFFDGQSIGAIEMTRVDVPGQRWT